MNKYTKSYNVILDNMDLNHYRLRPIAAIMYVQDAFARYCATKKIAAYDLFEKNLYWVITEFNVEFTDTLPFWSEEITAEIWFSEVTKLKIYTDFVIKHKDKIFAKGNICYFVLDQTTKRPAKTDTFAEKYDVCSELSLGEHKKFILGDIGEKISEIAHQTNLSDLDFNNHVNNKSYVNIAEMTAPDGYQQTHALKTMSIKYNHESFLGDTLVCSLYRTEIPNSYIHRIEKDGVSVCDIKTSWVEKLQDEKIIDYPLSVKSNCHC